MKAAAILLGFATLAGAVIVNWHHRNIRIHVGSHEAALVYDRDDMRVTRGLRWSYPVETYTAGPLRTVGLYDGTNLVAIIQQPAYLLTATNWISGFFRSEMPIEWQFVCFSNVNYATISFAFTTNLPAK